MKSYARNKRGMTLVEVITAVGIFVLIIGAVFTFETNIFSYNTSVTSSYQVAQDSQRILKTMLTELRESAPSATGAYALDTVGSTTLSFYSDVNNDGLTEQITYSLIGNTLYRASISPSGTPYTYPSANQSTTTLLTNVRNGTTTPVFEYFDTNYTGTSSPLTQPVTATSVRLIRITVILDTDPTKSPVPITYTTEVNLRNLKSNL
ncbi:MAG: type II secretion system protein [Candidatus Taylorbacteria bacterium]